MALGSTRSIAMCGLQALPITVEAHSGTGLPAVHIVGKADIAVRESAERIRAAFHNCALPWPRGRLTLSLSPADIPKAGAHFDLAIATAIMLADENANITIPHESDTAFLGEVGLDGRILPTKGVLPMVIALAKEGITRVYLSEDNKEEAELVPDITVCPLHSLRELCDPPQQSTLHADSPTSASQTSSSTAPGSLSPASSAEENKAKIEGKGITKDFSDIKGQRVAIDAAIIAAAGGHHMLLLGPPGSGKSMIAERLPGILPPLNTREAMDVTSIHSLVGDIDPRCPLIRTPPFHSPHMGVSIPALLGGGTGIAQPGLITLAHKGILFIDECTEIPTHVLDSLRVPLQEGEVALSRSKGTVRYPAQCQVIFAGNPCPCGAPTPQDCRCSSQTIAKYHRRLSGPLLDRIDIRLRLAPVGLHVLSSARGPSSEQLSTIVSAARQRSTDRWGDTYTNATVPDVLLEQHPLPPRTLRPLLPDLTTGVLSARGLSRIIRLAWTIADIAGNDRPTTQDVTEALALRAPLVDLS